MADAYAGGSATIRSRMSPLTQAITTGAASWRGAVRPLDVDLPALGGLAECPHAR